MGYDVMYNKKLMFKEKAINSKPLKSYVTEYRFHSYSAMHINMVVSHCNLLL